MFELSHELAQNIVDRTMAILPCNVNVMDSQGLILGSGEADRIDTRHEGAQLVLANHRIVEIDEQSARHLKGVQPGINLPLMHEEKLIGVLGISGEPEALRTYAKLVRMTAEMLINHSHTQAEQQWHDSRRDDLLAALLGDARGSQRLIDEAQQLGLKPHLSRTPHLIEIGEGHDSIILARWIRSQYPESWCLAPSLTILQWCSPSSIPLNFSRLIERLKAQGWIVRHVASGGASKDVHHLQRSCQRTAELLTYMQTVQPDLVFATLASHSLPAFLWTHRNHDVVEDLLAPFNELASRDANGQLLRTLRSWCKHDGQPQACSEALGVHRNSLRYRLERIGELIGKDVNRLSDLVELYLAIQLMPEDE
ncbi:MULTISPECIES: sugar diacid recognition domain-containing protein [Pseudomonas]|uniref:sugar diacid recognition domain-containing protein n=1 Tax=Pseudomonas TaxID=286 RepID=UPI001C2F9D35|nr:MULTISPECIES: sugar diacid recognition domain-containing protein [Pseudomonas]MBV2079634.1 helix-turn-helix domain-containing protein [Pseudomonas carnis]MBV2085388.1 helix-turn-helix domain-containing protein [Pseudomonas carnis]MDO3689362.1 sugar diacid recognition domain-containing protein [Pseudomonas sp. DKN 2791]MDO7031253.1 sugar diacid recognition domain-containing protein [Pseudomonas sp. DKN 2792]MDR6580925.1 carbohydrate diacid regulator [Pseudomonas extremaustralis]